MSRAAGVLPFWVDVLLIPLLNIGLAFLVSGLVIVTIGENPLEAVRLMVYGAFGYEEAIGYTLYYATNFIFTGLAVAVAFHAGLFNIGGEGQAYIGGLGLGLVCLATDQTLPFALIVPLMVLSSALFGLLWALVPGYLQAYRGSHVVITTIMFNFIASALMVYLMVNVLIEPGSMSPESRSFAESAWIPSLHGVLAMAGTHITPSPANVSLLWALVCCVFVWLFIWHSRWGYAVRTVGSNESAARYAGINTRRVVVFTMCVSGALAGFVALNEIGGVHHRLLLNFTAGYGFTGIAVSLMGRNHPLGIVLASLLFGALYQGGAELAFEVPTITRDLVVVIQGLVILFSGALAYMLRPLFERIWLRLSQPAAVTTDA